MEARSFLSGKANLLASLVRGGGSWGGARAGCLFRRSLATLADARRRAVGSARRLAASCGRRLYALQRHERWARARTVYGKDRNVCQHRQRAVLAFEVDLDLVAIDFDVARDHVDQVSLHRFDQLWRQFEMIGHQD